MALGNGSDREESSIKKFISLLTANITKPEDFKRLLFFTVSVCTSEHSFSPLEGLLEDIQLLPFASRTRCYAALTRALIAKC